MTYIPTEWSQGDKITSAKMNKLEQGVYDAQSGAATKESVDLLYKLTKGQAWDILADNTTAYQKSIPSGTHLSVLNGWGGKSIVWNQRSVGTTRCAVGTSTTFAGGNGTITNNGDGSITVSGNFASADFTALDSGIGVISGHKYFIDGVRAGSATTYGLSIGANTIQQTNTPVIAEGTSSYQWICIRWNAGVTINETFKPMVIDLTQMFGAGNEPTTAEAFRAMFPADYYPYNAGETMHGDVTGIVLKDAEQQTVKTLTVPADVRALTGYGQTGSAITHNAGDKTWAYTYNGTTTDITDLMTGFDNYLNEVEPGGSLTFQNSHGTDYGIPVPSQVDNYRNLSEVSP